MKRYAGIISLLLILMLVGTTGALAAGAAVAQGDADQHGAKISQSLTVWEESTSSSELVRYLAQGSGQSQALKSNGTQQKEPAAYDGKLVFADNRYLNWDIFVLDVATGKESWIGKGPKDQLKPDIYKNNVVWQDRRDGNWDIFLYNLDTGKELPVTGNEDDQINPQIYGDYIVWQDERDDNWDIYGYGISTGKEFVIDSSPKNQVSPRVEGDYVVWADDQAGNWEIYLYNFKSAKTTRITKADDDQSNPVVSGSVIIWQDDSNGNWDLYGYDIYTDKKFPVAVEPKNQLQPDIYGNKVVYTDDSNYNNDIKMLKLSTSNPVDDVNEEPSEQKSSGLTVELNGGELSLSVPPVMNAGRVLVPLRGIADALGLSTQWHNESQSIAITGDGTSIALAIGKKEVSVGPDNFTLDTVPFLNAGHTYVPVRFVSEAFGASVDWDDAVSTVKISK
ncbi:hypothetical protein MFMK1_000666 [Metallumcola ferriviriculae]|uniref:Copper amine oxidase-like N-terminal domain-containing protein n=1 Tax=Metallumcola ferriviriculae TaxID=3039180 RepID=A0AAU0UIK3_9FIRM|nr:hypothetical protein MFMK1_000666 [Desulfitibacteraceae bacterium MK1]